MPLYSRYSLGKLLPDTDPALIFSQPVPLHKTNSENRFLLQALRSCYLLSFHRQGWRCPLTFDYRFIGPVQAQEQVEIAFWCRKPIALFFCAGRIMLHVQIEGTIGVEFQRITVADGKAFDGVGREVSMFIVKRERPKCSYRRNLIFLEVQRVVFRAVEWRTRRFVEAAQ